MTGPGVVSPATRSSASPAVRLLALATSGRACGACVHDGERVRAERSLDLGHGHAERVVELCVGALGEAGFGWGDITHVGVDVGPGSFTGVRAGVAAARALALSLGVPAIGTSAFDALAAEWWEDGGEGARADPLVVALDLRRGRVGVQVFERGRPAGEPVAAAPEAVAAVLPGRSTGVRGGAIVTDAGAASIGSAWREPALRAAMLDALAARSGAADASWPSRLDGAGIRAGPTARGVALAALGRLRAAGPLPPPVPLYMRAPDAKLPGGVDPAAALARTPPVMAASRPRAS